MGGTAVVGATGGTGVPVRLAIICASISSLVGLGAFASSIVLATAPRYAPGPAPPIAPNIKLAKDSSPISLMTALLIPRSLATPSKNSCVPSSKEPAVVPKAMRPKRFFTEPVISLSN